MRDDSAFILTNCFVFSYDRDEIAVDVMGRVRPTRRYEEKSERENEYHAKCVMLCGAPVREVTANSWIRQCYLLSLFPLICPRNTFYSCITQYIVAETYNSCLLCLVHDSRLPTGRSRILSHSAARESEGRRERSR